MAATMQLQFLASQNGQNSPRDDPVKLLPWAIYVRCASKHHGEIVGLEKGLQTHIGGSAGNGIWRAWVERGIFFDEAVRAAVNFGRGHMDVFF